MDSKVEVDILGFTPNPFCFWDYHYTKALIDLKWAAIKAQGTFLNVSDYTTNGYLSKKIMPEVKRLKLHFRSDLESYLEDYSEEHLGYFYTQNGLIPFATENLNDAQVKLDKAILLFSYPEGPLKSINLLVRSIHVLKQEKPEIDISHSDPQIPFSIFVSVCDEESDIFNLRLAEGILHEAMHLQLSLIEDIIPLVKPHTGSVYFSPWRDEKRPAQGILHGLFVFRAIYNFYGYLGEILKLKRMRNYLITRMDQIEYEVHQLNGFDSCEDLTESGSNLVKNLLTLN